MTPARKLLQDRDIHNLAQATLNSASQRAITGIITRQLGLNTAEQIQKLHAALSYAYAQGYIRGRDTGRAHIVRLPEEPTPSPET